MTKDEIGRDAPEMVRRVAEAIADAFMEDYGESPAYYETMARAAIEAMRDPPQGIIAAVENMAEERYRAAPDMQRWYGEDVWNAGIDAALSDRTGADQAGEPR